MNLPFSHRWFFATCILAGLLCLASGCASTPGGYRQAERTGDRMEEFRQDIRNIQEAIDETTLAMTALVAARETDPRPAFADFDKAVGKLETADFKAKRSADTMRDEGKLFFELWQIDIANTRNEKVRQLAEQRKAELSRRFLNISRISVMVKDDLNPWISDVRDLHKFLSNDLTPTGISLAAQMVTDASQRGGKVKSSLDRLVQELNLVQAAITPATEESSPQSAMAR